MQINRLLKYCFLGFIVLLITGCQLRPLSVLSHDEMVSLLYDIQMAESTVSVLQPHARVIEKQEYFNNVLKKHGVTKEEFYHSVEWYSNNPKKYQLVYDDLQIRSDEIMAKVDAYEFHPESRPTINDTIDTFDIWCWRKHILLVKNKRDLKLDSVNFVIDDTLFFAKNNKLWWSFVARACADTAKCDSVRMLLFFEFENNRHDTLSYWLATDSVARQYIFKYPLNDSLRLDKLALCFADSVQNIDYLRVDSIKLLRIFDKFNTPVVSDVRKRVKESVDSAENVFKKDNKKKVSSKKKIYDKK